MDIINLMILIMIIKAMLILKFSSWRFLLLTAFLIMSYIQNKRTLIKLIKWNNPKGFKGSVNSTTNYSKKDSWQSKNTSNRYSKYLNHKQERAALIKENKIYVQRLLKQNKEYRN